MPSHAETQGNSAEACGLTIRGTPPGGPGNRPTGFSRIASEGEAFTGQTERWLVAWSDVVAEGGLPVGEPRWDFVEATTWFDARAAARARLRELGLPEGHPFELGRIVP